MRGNRGNNGHIICPASVREESRYPVRAAAHKSFRSLFVLVFRADAKLPRLPRDRGSVMQDLLAAIGGGVVGYALSTLDTRRASMWLQGYMMMAGQLAAVRMENQSLRRRGKRPSMPPHRKWLFGTAYRFCPMVLTATGFSPQTLVCDLVGIPPSKSAFRRGKGGSGEPPRDTRLLEQARSLYALLTARSVGSLSV
jgi:hypothetical protein